MAQVRYDGTGDTVDLILNGQYENPQLDAACKLFIQHMKRKTLQELDSSITREDFLGKLKSWPEKTTTSPSGVHLGHYHSLWKPHNINATTHPREAKLLEEKRETILQAHLAILNYAVKFGYSYQRWQNVVNVMIKKDSNSSRIHRLRVIHLYEADYNLLLAVKWRQATHHAEDSNLLNQGLYGSRPGRSAHDPVFIDIMQNETYRASMKAGIHKELDATSCYDRILAWLANTCSRRMGVHKMVAAVNCKTLEKAKYHLKTSMKVSDEFYQHCTTHPIYGTGQGSGNSPHIWCFISSTLFDAFDAKAHGATFYSYNGKQSIKIYMLGFVDDCSQQVNEFRSHPQPTAHRLVELMQGDAQLWNNLLWTSGGALEIPKCSFQIISTEDPFSKGSATQYHSKSWETMVPFKSNNYPATKPAEAWALNSAQVA